MPNQVSITKLHPRAEWLLRGANQHKLVDVILFLASTTVHNVAGATTSPRNNPGLNVLKLGARLRIVPIDTAKRGGEQDD